MDLSMFLYLMPDQTGLILEIALVVVGEILLPCGPKTFSKSPLQQ